MGIKTFFNNVFSADTSRTDKSWISMREMLSGFFGGKSKSGILVTEKTALFNSAVFACNRAISESLAILPRHIFEGTGAGKVPVLDHPTVRVLTREANPIQTSYKFFETVQHHVISSGNGYAEIQRKRGAGDVVGMWPIPPGNVTPKVIIDEKGDLEVIYLIRLNDGTEKILRSDQMLHVPGIGYDGIQGYPLVEFMLNAVGLGASLEEYASVFFKQGASQGGYVTVPDDFQFDQVQNLKQHYSVLNEGLDNAHRFKFLYDSVKFTPASISPQDSQMIESRVFQIQEVARFHRMPLHKIQEVSKSPSYNSLEQFNVEFANDTLMPYVVNWEQELTRKIFLEKKDANKYIKFNINAILRGDLKARGMFLRTLVMSGIMSRNEARALEDLPPIAGGDEAMIPANMILLSERQDDAAQRVQD